VAQSIPIHRQQPTKNIYTQSSPTAKPQPRIDMLLNDVALSPKGCGLLHVQGLQNAAAQLTTAVRLVPCLQVG